MPLCQHKAKLWWIMAKSQIYNLMVQFYLEPIIRLLKTLNFMLEMTFEVYNKDDS